jgi:type I restriction enzyme M protein
MLVRYAENYIRGIDFNPELARVAKMYMVLYDDGHSGIFSHDSLDSFDEIENQAIQSGANGVVGENAFDVILTNPPFGSKAKVTNKDKLRSFDLGYKWKKNSSTGKYEKTEELQNGQSPEILFIERCIDFLAPALLNSGRALGS